MRPGRAGNDDGRDGPGDGLAGLRLAATTLTVLPLPVGRVDRAAGRWAMALAPVVGGLLGALTVGLLAGLDALGASPLLAAVLAVGALALGTRGLHLDGLADTADGLGCHGPPERALAVMRSPEVGPFGVATLTVVLLGQVAALAALTDAHRWLAVGLAVATGRTALTWACRRGVPAARPTGLGALVAGTVPPSVPALWTVALAGVAVASVPGRPWQGPVAVVLALGAGLAVTAHVTRRLSGVTGDTLGAACEATVLAAAAVLSFGG